MWQSNEERCLTDVLRTLRNKSECIDYIRSLDELKDKFDNALIKLETEQEKSEEFVLEDSESEEYESDETEESIDSNDSAFEVTSSYIEKSKDKNAKRLREEIESLKTSLWCLGRDIRKKDKHDFSELAQHIHRTLKNAKSTLFDIDGQAKYMATYKY
jgi:hypothetical protein